MRLHIEVQKKLLTLRYQKRSKHSMEFSQELQEIHENYAFEAWYCSLTLWQQICYRTFGEINIKDFFAKRF